MNVERLVSVTGEEEKLVRAALQDGRTHPTGFWQQEPGEHRQCEPTETRLTP
jgi:hypothetical protein